MQPSFWIERWEKDQIGFHQQQVNHYLMEYWSDLELAPGAPVFVPMCGKSLDMVWLRERGHHVMGVELAQIAVRDFFAERGLAPNIVRRGALEQWEAGGYTLWCGDLFDLRPGDLSPVSAVFDRASLIALPEEMRRQYVAHMRMIVPQFAPTLLVALTYPQHEMQGPPFAVAEDEVRALYSQYAIAKLAERDVLSLEENARFRTRGLSRMSEQVYRIEH